jgi:UDP-glucose 4-epimerase
MPKVLVTGGAGFLGPHLIRQLLARNWSVASLDDYSVGKKEHIEPFLDSANFLEIEGSITDAAFVKAAVARFDPEVIYHLAAIHFIPYCVAHPAETLKVNVLGTQHLLDAMEDTSVRRFVLASTADVYATANLPHGESDRLGSTNIYGISKEVCERLLDLMRRRMPERRFLAARFFNIYGPGETNPHVLPDIMGYLRKGNVLRLGDVEPKRDYVFTDDVARALVLMADYSGTHDAFNVGTGEGKSVRELVEILARVHGTPLTIETDPKKFRRAERQSLVADIRLIKAELGWEPEVDMEHGLARTLEDALGSTASPS